MNKSEYLPDHSEILESISELKNVQWASFTGKNLKKYLEDNHELITSACKIFTNLYLNPDKDKQLKLNVFRVRAYNDIQNLNLRCEYSYPPINFSKNLRANLKGFPVFYGSDNPYTALTEYIREYDIKENYTQKAFAISRWSLNANASIMLAPFFPEETINSNPYAQLSQFSNEDFRNQIGTNITDDKINGIRELNQFFSKQFLSDNKYSISSYLGYKSIYDNPVGNTILLYPSRRLHTSKTNFAFHPNFVDEHMKLELVYFVFMKNIIIKKNEGITFESTIEPKFLINDSSRLKRVDTTKYPQNKGFFEKNIKQDFSEENVFEFITKEK